MPKKDPDLVGWKWYMVASKNSDKFPIYISACVFAKSYKSAVDRVIEEVNEHGQITAEVVGPEIEEGDFCSFFVSHTAEKLKRKHFELIDWHEKVEEDENDVQPEQTNHATLRATDDGEKLSEAVEGNLTRSAGGV